MRGKLEEPIYRVADFGKRLRELVMLLIRQFSLGKPFDCVLDHAVRLLKDSFQPRIELRRILVHPAMIPPRAGRLKSGRPRRWWGHLKFSDRPSDSGSATLLSRRIIAEDFSGSPHERA